MEILQFISNNSVIFTILGVLGSITGWIWAVFQFFSNKEHTKKDKIFEKRYEAYTSYINKRNEINKEAYNNTLIFQEFAKEFILHQASGNLQELETKIKTLPLIIEQKYHQLNLSYESVYSELANLSLICSDELYSLVIELKQLTKNVHDEQKLIFDELRQINFQNIQLQNPPAFPEILIKREYPRIQEIKNEILSIMRKELSYYNKK